MDREEVLHKFHWHRWGASNMGAITISKEDMEEYYMLIKDLIAENKKLHASCTKLTEENKKLLNELTTAEVMLEDEK
jgi:hypothetical protein